MSPGLPQPLLLNPLESNPIIPLLFLLPSAFSGRSYLIAAMVLLLVGTASIFVAVETGEAAGKLAERSPGMEHVLETHGGAALHGGDRHLGLGE